VARTARRPAPAGQPRLVVGLVRGIHGLKGAVRLEILSDDARRFAVRSVLYAEGSPEPLTIAWSQPDEPGILVRFNQVTTREQAELLRGRYLEAEASAKALPEGTFYWHEITGAAVTTTAGEALGSVADVFRVGESEVFVVRGGPRGELYVPAVSAVVRELAPRDGRIVVDADALGLDEEPPAPKRTGPRTSRARKKLAAAALSAAESPAAALSAARSPVATPGDPAPTGAGEASASEAPPDPE